MPRHQPTRESTALTIVTLGIVAIVFCATLGYCAEQRRAARVIECVQSGSTPVECRQAMERR